MIQDLYKGDIFICTSGRIQIKKVSKKKVSYVFENSTTVFEEETEYIWQLLGILNRYEYSFSHNVYVTGTVG